MPANRADILRILMALKLLSAEAMLFNLLKALSQRAIPLVVKIPQSLSAFFSRFESGVISRNA